MGNKIRKIIMYSTVWCSDCHRAKHFMQTYKIEYEEIDVDINEDAAEIVREINGGNRSVPTIIISYEDNSQDILVEPSFEELAETFL